MFWIMPLTEAKVGTARCAVPVVERSVRRRNGTLHNRVFTDIRSTLRSLQAETPPRGVATNPNFRQRHHAEIFSRTLFKRGGFS